MDNINNFGHPERTLERTQSIHNPITDMVELEKLVKLEQHENSVNPFDSNDFHDFMTGKPAQICSTKKDATFENDSTGINLNVATSMVEQSKAKQIPSYVYPEAHLGSYPEITQNHPKFGNVKSKLNLTPDDIQLIAQSIVPLLNQQFAQSVPNISKTIGQETLQTQTINCINYSVLFPQESESFRTLDGTYLINVSSPAFFVIDATSRDIALNCNARNWLVRITNLKNHKAYCGECCEFFWKPFVGLFGTGVGILPGNKKITIKFF